APDCASAALSAASRVDGIILRVRSDCSAVGWRVPAYFYELIQRSPIAMPPIFPFTAIVGQERMKRALVLNAVNPRIGGVLIRGERGTAQSNTARALAALLTAV